MTSRVGAGGFKDWAELRTHANELFHETPNPITEQTIIDAYQLHPDAVEKAINAVAIDVQAGTIRSGWGVLRKRAETIRQPPTNPTRTSSISREKSIMRAEQWIRAAGIHYDRESELQLELFGSTGVLRPYAQIDLEPAPETDNARWQLGQPRGDQTLIDRITTLWHQHRPEGEAIEADVLERAKLYGERQKQLATLTAHHHETLAAAQPEREPITVGANDDIPF